MYGLGEYAHMGPPVMQQLGIGPLDMAAQASDTKTGGGILDWINFGINTAVGVKDAITGTKTPVLLSPVQPKPSGSNIKILGMSPTTLLLVGGAVVVGVVLLSSRKRR